MQWFSLSDSFHIFHIKVMNICYNNLFFFFGHCQSCVCESSLWILEFRYQNLDHSSVKLIICFLVYCCTNSWQHSLFRLIDRSIDLNSGNMFLDFIAFTLVHWNIYGRLNPKENIFFLKCFQLIDCNDYEDAKKTIQQWNSKRIETFFK